MKKVIMLGALCGLFVVSCGKKEEVPDYAKNRAEQAEENYEAEKATDAAKADSNDPMQNKGIGPVKSVELGDAVDETMAAKGQEVFNAKCTACHKPDQKFIGPAPKGILQRRSPEWIMNMILNPEEMVQKDPIAKKLLAEANGAPMANQNLTEQEAREVLEYFRTLE